MAVVLTLEPSSHVQSLLDRPAGAENNHLSVAALVATGLPVVVINIVSTSRDPAACAQRRDSCSKRQAPRRPGLRATATLESLANALDDGHERRLGPDIDANRGPNGTAGFAEGRGDVAVYVNTAEGEGCATGEGAFPDSGALITNVSTEVTCARLLTYLSAMEEASHLAC